MPSRPKSYQGFRETGPWRKRKKACWARWEGERQKKGAFSHRPTPAPSIFRLYGTCLHISHNAPYLPPQILHNLCVSFLLGITAVLREIENTAYAKKGVWGTYKVHCQWRCASGVMLIGTPSGSLCRGESVYWENQFWCCPRVSGGAFVPYFKAHLGGFWYETPGPNVGHSQFFLNKMTNARGDGYAWNLLSHKPNFQE